jgi:hypothetical protein
MRGRPKGSRNKRTLLREAEEALGRTRDPNKIVDMLLVIEKAASHFYLRAEMGKGGIEERPPRVWITDHGRYVIEGRSLCPDRDRRSASR